SSDLDSDFLGVWATRVTYEKGGNTIDLIWQPWFTPSRTPLLNQRWAPLPPELTGVQLIDGGARYPGRSQFGARWNHVASAGEFSFSYFDGFHHLPSFNPLLDPQTVRLNPTTGGRLDLTSFTVPFERFYPRLRMIGADTAIPLRWLTVKGEAGYFTFPNNTGSDEYVLYVIQLERQVKEWSFVGGYAGEAR